jgi:aspartate/glutamate racemase
MSQTYKKFLGLLGGMGPLASALFMTRLTQLTPAIALVKANKVLEAYEPLAEVARALVKQGAQAIVLGCT